MERCLQIRVKENYKNFFLANKNAEKFICKVIFFIHFNAFDGGGCAGGRFK
jgi:hypothetical protein